MKKELFRINNGSVIINHQKILTNIYLQFFYGETSGILFNSFEERDAFIKLMDGDITMDFGWLYYNEELLTPSQYPKILKQNTAVITEDNRLMSALSITENLFFSDFSPCYIHTSLYSTKAQELLRFFQLDIPLQKPIKELTPLERISLELVKAFALNKKMIILSNVTGILNFSQLSRLFLSINKLKEKGFTFILTETFEDTIFQLTDNLHVIKNGRTVRILTPENMSKHTIQQVLGQYRESASPDSISDTARQENIVLSFSNVCDHYLNQVSFDLRKGEILKLLCPNEECVAHLIRLLHSQCIPLTGGIFLDGKPFRPLHKDKLYLDGIGYIPANPRETAIFKNLSVMDNLCIPLSDKIKGFWTRNKYQKSVAYMLKDIIPDICYTIPIKELPSSILQKIVYSRWLLYAPKLLVCINPFSIVDTAVNQVTEQMLKLLTDRGIAVLIITDNWSLKSALPSRLLYLADR
ncbi:MAG: hypothetical protein Q4D16_21670 [Eubacteriales bacterium]|nr:hypothetical protein [Eubacteriales bacterium]